MPRPRNEERRVLGPTWIPSRKKWRVLSINPGETKEEDRERSRFFDDEHEAAAHAEELRQKLAKLNSRPIEDAITLYETFLMEKGTGEVSRKETIRRLRLFFDAVKDRRVSRLLPEEGKQLYDDFRQRKKHNSNETVSATYQLNTLAEAKSFCRWWVKNEWVLVSPLDGVDPIGSRDVGKDQMTGDEASVLFKWLLWKAHRREDGHARRDSDAAIGVMMALSMGLRSSDLTKRLVRDVDLNCTALRVGLERARRSKSKKGDRARRIPRALQPLVKQMIEGRDRTAPLFPASEEGGHHTKSWLRFALRRFCRDAGIPYFCPHSLKGTAGTALAEGGELADKIAEFLSHEDKRTSTTHYVADGAIANGQVERNFEVLIGGKAAG